MQRNTQLKKVRYYCIIQTEKGQCAPTILRKSKHDAHLLKYSHTGCKKICRCVMTTNSC